MKKILLTLGLASLAAISSQAQGLVDFTSATQNTSTNNSIAQLGATASGRLSGAGSYYFALFYSTSPISLGATTGTNGTYAFSSGSGVTLVTSSYGTNSPTAGRFAAVNGNSDASIVVPIAAGGTGYFDVVGWSANLGTTISALQQSLTVPGTVGFLGQSVASGAITIGNSAIGGSTPDSALFGGAAPFIQGFTLGSFIIPVPEPTSIALAAMGGLSLLALRRKKA